MPTRVHLSRILAINWYGYRRFIDFAGLSLITGPNGSGKSVLLDLIQFVMLGESLSRFNKAAAGSGSGRSLRGYCLCDTNAQGNDGQERLEKMYDQHVRLTRISEQRLAYGSARRDAR